MEKEILITEFDLERLEGLLDMCRGVSNFDDGNLETLQKKISNCIIVPPEFIPDTVVTMNSNFTIKDEGTGKENTYTLVFPEDADISGDKISILAPIGTAMLGRKVGDFIKWAAPSGLKQIKFVKINFQPETCGQFNL